MTGRARTILAVPLGIALVGVIIHGAWVLGLGPSSLAGFMENWVYSTVSVAAAAACFLRAWLGADKRPAWVALGTGLALSASGDIYLQVAYADGATVPYPGPSDALYLLSYPALYIGLVLLVRTEHSRFGPASWIDGLIGALAAASLATALLAPALVGLTDGSTGEALTNIAYPGADLLLIAFVVGLLILDGRRPSPQILLIGAGLGAWAVADGINLYQSATTGYVEGTPLDSVWLLGSLAIASAALAGSSQATRTDDRRSIVFPVVSALVATAIQVWDHFDTLPTSAIALSAATLLAVCLRLLLSFSENRKLLAEVHREAATDALTGLPNRRTLMHDLEQRLARGDGPLIFALFDLDGFKAYNDSFGHPAGDLLLHRLGKNLGTAVEPFGSAYRLGGDEFCVMTEPGNDGAESALAPATEALTESGEGFSIGVSFGHVLIPAETSDPEEALGLADRRMYAAKGSRSTAAERQTRSVLLRVLREREPELSAHLEGVADLVTRAGKRLGLSAEQLDMVARAAEMHDIGKIAIPDAVLHKPGPLDDLEWRLMRTHTLIGERILNAAPALTEVASIVRSSHERWDGGGYPDALAAEAIPVGSRLIFICDAYDAMVEGRPYGRSMTRGEALAEIRANAGTQFDPNLAELVCREIESTDPREAWASAGSARSLPA